MLTSSATDIATGIHLDIPFEDYLSWPGLSQTDLKAIHDCPAKYEWRKTHPRKTTPAQAFGTIVHTAVLEPHEFDQRYVARAKPDLRTKAGKARWAEWLAEAEQLGREVVPLDDYDTATWMRDAVRSHPAASELLNMKGNREVSLRWDADGLPCKCRIDWLPTDEPFIVDLKTCICSRPVSFAYDVRKWGYHAQAFWYTEGEYACEAVAHDNPLLREYRIIAVEKHPPYVVSVISLDVSTFLGGEDICTEALRTYKQCMESGRWPGYSDDVEEISIPVRKTEETEETEQEEDDDDGSGW